MSKKLMSIAVLAVLAFVIAGCTKEVPENPIRYSNLRGEYLGQTPPGNTAEVFALGVVSTGMNERDAAFSPNLDEFYYSIWENGRGSIVVMKKVDNKWTNPEVVSFSGVYNDIEPFVSSDGSKIYFASNRPVEGSDPKDFDIWVTERSEDGEWGEPKNLGAPVNSEADEFYPSLTDKGDIYLTIRNEMAMGREDIFVSRLVDGEYQPIENLGEKVNSEKDEFNSFIARDGSFLLYTTTGFGDGLGGGDIWVNFKLDDGSWSGPKNLGDAVNSNKLEYCPSITPDGKYLIFTSNRVNDRIYNERVSYEELVEEYNNPYNGAGDIYWVSTNVIDKQK